MLDADAKVAWYEATKSFSFVLPGDKVWTQDIELRQNPAANVTIARNNAATTLSGIALDLSQPVDAVQLTAVPGVSNTYVALNTPGDFSSGVLDNWIQPQFVPQPNGQPSFGYAVRLYDGDPNSGGTEVLTTEGTTGVGDEKSVAWMWNYDNGLLLLSKDFSVTDPYINGFQYIGNTVSNFEQNVTIVNGDLIGDNTGGVQIVVDIIGDVDSVENVQGDVNIGVLNVGTTVFDFTAEGPSNIVVGDIVYITGPSVGNQNQVDIVDIEDLDTIPAVGIVTQEINTTRVRVAKGGFTSAFTGLVPNRQYFIGNNSKLALIEDIALPAPGQKQAIQPVGQATDVNEFFVQFGSPIIRVGV